jgi:hypothetical protein
MLGLIDFKFSNGWLDNFKKRFGIKEHKIVGESSRLN